MDAGAMQAAAAASAASYRSFADATGAVLDLLERHLPGTTPFLAHLDRSQGLHRLVDVRAGRPFALRSNQAMPLDESLCGAMAEERAPRLCNDVAGHPVYGGLPPARRRGVRSYIGVPLELSDGSRVGSLAAYARDPGRFRVEDEQLFAMLARMLSAELERETNERDLVRLNDALRAQASAMGALRRVAEALGAAQDARYAICEAACEVSNAGAAFLLEPSGREFSSTASYGVDTTPVTIQPRADAHGRAFQATHGFFVADARDHPALAAQLVDATGARSVLFEPILREERVSGVLLLIWREQLDGLAEPIAAMVRVVAAQAGAAIQQASLRSRVDELAMTDPLTGLLTRRVWDQELPRELARARRNDAPVSIGLLDIDRMGAFNLLRGEQEGDRLIKETAALWDRQLREVDVLARIDGQRFGIVLPSCGLPEACEVMDRVRAATPRGQTASAGVARWDGEEPAELLMLRAADALAAAKTAGRNVTMAAE